MDKTVRFSEKQAFLALLVEVARADQRVAPEERAVIHSHLHHLADEEEIGSIVDRLDSAEATGGDEALAAIAEALGRSALPSAVRDAFILAASDGEIAREELDVLRRFLLQAGVPREHFPMVVAWCEQALDHIRQARYIFGIQDTRLTPPGG